MLYDFASSTNYDENGLIDTFYRPLGVNSVWLYFHGEDILNNDYYFKYHNYRFDDVPYYMFGLHETTMIKSGKKGKNRFEDNPEWITYIKRHDY